MISEHFFCCTPCNTVKETWWAETQNTKNGPVFEVKWVYEAGEGFKVYCIHKFRELKLVESNLDLLERKLDEKENG